MLANNELYFSISELFNDPFDCRARKEFEFTDDEDFIKKWTPLEASQQNISIEEAHNYIKEITSNQEAKEEYIERKSQMFQKLVLQSFGVYSFSEVPDDILMWSHYADSHKGLCVIFNRKSDNDLADARPVDYPENDEFPFINYWLGPNIPQLDEIIKIILTKSKHWKHEKEWRLIDRPEVIDKHYKGHSKKYTDDMLNGIIFGLRMDSNAKNTIRNIFSGKTVNYYEARVVKNKFRLEIVNVD
jgi:hypothetical protein